MFTDLNVVQPQIEPSRKIDVLELKCLNFPLSNALGSLSETMIAAIKSASNNMQAAVVPRDVTALLMGWATFKKQVTFALENNNGSQTGHEQKYSIYVPTHQEIMLMPNKKFKIINNHFFRVTQVALSTDAARVGANLDDASFKAIDREIKTTDIALAKWVGTGENNQSVGEEMPLFVQTGTIRPDIMNIVSTGESNPDAPLVGMPDAPDVLVAKKNGQ